MFIHDDPITSASDNELGEGRLKVSEELAKKIQRWEGEKSLILALYGEWGTGKSSVVNLAKEYIEKNSTPNSYIIVEFNPWQFSESDNLNEKFFDELSEALFKKNNKVLATKLREYSKALEFVPNKNTGPNNISIIGPLIVICFPQLFIGTSLSDSIEKRIFWFFFTSLAMFLCWLRGIFKIASEYLTLLSNKSIPELKQIIEKQIKNKKLIIIIDDIDRLNPNEVKQIFTIIRMNAAFKNTIFVLPFERRIIESYLTDKDNNVSGHEFLKKIVQIDSDVPSVDKEKIHSFLFTHINKILETMPSEQKNFFDQNYFGNVFHAGYKDFFLTLRDVKRYINSLSISLGLLHQNEVVEVNIVDYFAVEALRVFVPSFYYQLKNEKSLFTSTGSSSIGLQSGFKTQEERREKIELLLENISVKNRKSVWSLIGKIFPQIEVQHDSEFQSEWSKDLRVCSTRCFDTYFTLVPGGDEKQISYYEIVTLLEKSNSPDAMTSEFRNYIQSNRIRELLERIQDYTNDKELIPQTTEKNIIQALFNISDELPEDKRGFMDFGADTDLLRVVKQLLKRNEDKEQNFNTLYKAIENTTGIYGPIKRISLESSSFKENKNEYLDIPSEKLNDIINLCVQKTIEKLRDPSFFNHSKILYILYRLKDWNVDISEFLQGITNNTQLFIDFLMKFDHEHRSITLGDSVQRTENKYEVDQLKDFFNLHEVKNKLEELKDSNSEYYQKNKESVDYIIDNIEQYLNANNGNNSLTE